MVWEITPPLSEHTPPLNEAMVDVWRVLLDEAAAGVVAAAVLPTLARDERERAERFRFERDRARFVAARGFLRSVLSVYLGARPAEVEFAYGEFGKPSLSARFDSSGLRFNVSHTHGAALFAVTSGREVGVDVECVRDRIECEQIAGRFFSAREAETLRALPRDARARAFFRCWTMKEAYVKARGEGFSYPLARFSVGFAPGEPENLNVADDAAESARWRLRSLPLGDAYAGAVVAEGREWELRLRELSPERFFTRGS